MIPVHSKADELEQPLLVMHEAATQVAHGTSHCREHISFIGRPLSKGEVQRRWPVRRTVDDVEHCASGEAAATAALHYESLRLVDASDGCDQIISVGDFVEVALAEDGLDPEGVRYFGVLRVTELFADDEGEKRFKGHWFYLAWETVLAKFSNMERQGQGAHNATGRPEILGPTDCQRLWRATLEDSESYGAEFSADVIQRRVLVEAVAPGDVPPQLAPRLRPGDPAYCTAAAYCTTGPPHYWFNSSYTQRYFTFESYYDVIEPWQKDYQPPAISSGSANTAAVRACASSSAPSVMAAPPEKRQMYLLEVFAGAGGYSYLAQRDESCEISCCWAVDTCEAACTTYTINHPEAQVHCMSVDEFLMLVVLFDKLSDRVPDRGSGDGSSDHSSCCSSRDDSASEEEEGVYRVEAIVGVKPFRIQPQEEERRVDGGSMPDPDQWELRFRVKWRGWDASHNTWEPLAHLGGCKEELAAAVRRWRRERLLPLLGDPRNKDLIICGGPPCQSLSGMNKSAPRADLFSDQRNCLVLPYLKLVQLLQPAYVCTEQVVDALIKDDSFYLKYLMTRLVSMEYQARVGVLSARNYGCAQERQRVFTIAARHDEQLPPLPLPTHLRVGGPARGSVKLFRNVYVEADDGSAAGLLPPVVLGDILSDLPQVSNFGMSLVQYYCNSPRTLAQLHLRRDPPQGAATLDQRLKALDANVLAAAAERLLQLQTNLTRDNGLVAVGQSLGHRGSGTKRRHEDFGDTDSDRPGKTDRLYEPQAACVGHALHIGAVVEREVNAAEALHAKAASALNDATELCPPLRNHAAMMVQGDDYERMKALPVGPPGDGCLLVSYRHLPGVVESPAGGCCAGHHHAEGCQQSQCTSRCFLLPSGNVLTPGVALRSRSTKGSRNAPYGRLAPDGIISTVFVEPEWRRLALIHPNQPRLMTVRELARVQSFPDHHVFYDSCFAPKPAKVNVTERAPHAYKEAYRQVGNAVAPNVAAALGCCLLMAAMRRAPPHAPVARVEVKSLLQAIEKAAEEGLKSYLEAASGAGPAEAAAAVDAQPAAKASGSLLFGDELAFDLCWDDKLFESSSSQITDSCGKRSDSEDSSSMGDNG